MFVYDNRSRTDLARKIEEKGKNEKGEKHMTVPMTFEEIFEQNKRRIHYHIHKLNIRDPHQEFYQEGLCALWNAYDAYKPEKGPMGTYFNFMIRNRLIDLIRKENRERASEEKTVLATSASLSDGNQLRRQETAALLHSTEDMPVEDEALLASLETHLTANQWKWVRQYALEGMSLKEIAEKEGTTVEAVKSWARQARRKLKDETYRKQIGWDA